MKSRMTMIVMIMGLALGGFGNAFGLDSYTAPFNTQNGTSYSCNVCHTNTVPVKNRNSFGADWANNSIGNHSYVITAALAKLDSDGDGFSNTVEIQAKTNPGDAASRPTSVDASPPSITAFSLPGTATSLTVAITTFTATDTVGVTGYRLTETNSAPTTGWTATAPGSYTFGTAGAKTLYAWARDAAGNVSSPRSAGVTITLPPGADTIPPTVTGFTVPVTAGSLTVAITLFAATDNVGVTGYLINEAATKPLASATGWGASVPTGYTFTTSGSKILYAWARDAAGNVSNTTVSQSVTITTGGGNDVESPEVMEFTLPLTSTSLTVPILAFRAIDNVDATAYLITTTPAAPAANATGWSATPRTSYTFTSGGAKTLYGWAKDAAGNVSESLWDNVDITASSGLPDISVNTSLDFEGVGVNENKEKELKVTNQGKATLAVTKVEVIGTDAAAFKPSAASFNVNPSVEYKLRINFKPTAQRSYRATLRIHSNDPDTPVKEVALTGAGTR